MTSLLHRRVRQIALAVLALGAAGVVARRLGRHATGRHVPGGVLISDAGSYDMHSRVLFGSLFREIAADVAAAAPNSARILEVGSGPGHLALQLAREHGLDVTGLDLDPAMVARAAANAGQPGEARRPTFVVGDVAALPFDDASFDIVVSTFSMHHWSDPRAGLNEIARVLRPGGVALIWDLKRGFALFHVHASHPLARVEDSALAVVSTTPWQWPWRFTLAQRLELARR